jgi:hypothetical protein
MQALLAANTAREVTEHEARMRYLTQKYQGDIAQAKQEMIDRKIDLGELRVSAFRPVNDFDFIAWSNKMAAEGGKILSHLGADDEAKK